MPESGYLLTMSPMRMTENMKISRLIDPLASVVPGGIHEYPKLKFIGPRRLAGNDWRCSSVQRLQKSIIEELEGTFRERYSPGTFTTDIQTAYIWIVRNLVSLLPLSNTP